MRRRQRYQDHHLFTEVLRNHLKQRHSDLIPALHQRASIWYEQQGLLVESAARLIELITLPVTLQGQISTVLGWLKALPEALIQTRPFLCIPHAALLIITNQLEAARAPLQAAERSVQKELSASQAQTILGWVLTLRGDIALFSGDIPQAVFLARQALEVLPEVEVLPRTDALSTTIRAYVASGAVTPATEQEVIAAIAFVRTSNNLFATV